MIRFSWLQFRLQAAVALAALAVAAVVLAVTGPHLAHLYDASGIATCQARGNCGPLTASLQGKLDAGKIDQVLYFLGIGVMFVLPAIIGMFWGAPLVARELETGSFRLAWTQGVTRTRWLAVKFGVVGLGAMATAGLLSLMLTWWSSPIDTAASLKTGNSISFIRLGLVQFATRGITPIGYAAFAFTLGVTTGVLIRRTIPAMAATLAAFTFIQIAMPLWIRPHLISPAHRTVALTTANISGLAEFGSSLTVMPPASANPAGAWILSTQTIDKAGHVFNAATTSACRGSNSQACGAALGRLHLSDVISYQPASRFWALQWYETAIFLALAVILAGVCCWRIRRRAA
jgi:ABC-type transport system involved in multi-copper enzyme maturation permease subunit